MSTFAKADTKAQWFAGAYPGARITPNCGVIHTTETTGWPGYKGGAEAPNYTAKPDMKAKRLAWRAHFPDEMSARALVNAPGGVETNTANAVQVELIGTCDPAHSKTWGSLKAGVDYIYWPTAPDWALQGVAEFLLDMHTRHGIPLSGVKTWLPYPKSYGSAGGQRMSFAQWRAFTGWCGHQHVPENDHGDPGALNFARILTLTAPQEAPDMQLTDKVTLTTFDATGKAIGEEQVPVSTFFNRMNWAYTELLRQRATEAAQTAAIKALAEAKGADAAAITQAVVDKINALQLTVTTKES